jgi:cardiolipin synthase A/B
MIAIAVAVVLTIVLVIVAANFRSPEKKIQHEMKHLYAIGDDQFTREMSTLLGPAIVSGNAIRALQNGDEIFPSMLEEISRAQHSITFETYIYWAGNIGAQFATALIDRAKAGVRVHVMLDWVGSAKCDAKQIDMMTRAGVEVRRYHPLRWYSLGRINNRTHRKTLVIDGRVGFIGGVGIADQWSGKAQDPAHWRDSHFRVEGPVIAQMQSAFLDNWIKTTGRVLHGADYFPELAQSGQKSMHLFASSPAGGSASMRLMYLTAITAATRTIDIQAAYFVPDALMSRELVRASERGVRIRVLVPGKHIDSEMVRAESKRGWGQLLSAGISIFQFNPTMLHCKMLIFDGLVVSVGSTNFDIRSFELNDEASLNIYDIEFAAQMTAVFESDLKLSTSYSLDDWRRRSLSEQLAEVVIFPITSQL